MNSDFYQVIGYSFQNVALLEEALTHTSIGSGNKDVNYERLEFLGDRILGFIVADLLFQTFPNENEGQLARRLSSMVRKETLVRVAEQINLGELLRLSKSEKMSGGHQKPSLLADCTESLIAAIYIDGGMGPAKDFIIKFWTPMLHETHSSEKDAKSILQEWVQAKNGKLPLYEVIETTGKDHNPLFKIKLTIKGLKPVEAIGKSKKEAEHNAAVKMLEIIKELEK